MNRFHSVATEVAYAIVIRHRRDRRQDQIRRPMKLLDDLVVQLEELHLAGRSRVPKDLQPALDRVNDALPEDLRERWRTGISIVNLADQAFDLQDRLLQRLGVAADDDDEDDDRGPQFPNRGVRPGPLGNGVCQLA
ncbi:MAG: hypothetical protein E6J14_02370 [Chloroflexi bacterium]|nr:MAG: hypothetical protein E6J14_02370 [Chloroflexota bacterium]